MSIFIIRYRVSKSIHITVKITASKEAFVMPRKWIMEIALFFIVSGTYLKEHGSLIFVWRVLNMTEKRNNRPQRCALVKEAYSAITDDMLEAVVLNQMIYWSERVNDFDQFIAEEKSQQNMDSEASNASSMLHGWIRKSAADMKAEIMSKDSSRTVSRKLDNLVSKGFLFRRHNPEYQYDHKYQYRINFKAILPALETCGLTLDGYKANLYSSIEHPPAQSEYIKTPEPEIKAEPKSANVPEIPENWSELLSAAITEAVTKVLAVILPYSMQEAIGGTIKQAVKFIATESFPGTALADQREPAASESTLPANKPVKKERFHFRKKKNPEELDNLLESICIDNIEDKKVSEQMKAIISDLWRTNRIGKKSVSHGMVMKALSSLTPKSIEVIFEKYTRQEKKGLIQYPSEYIKTLIMNASQDWELRKLAQTGNSNESKPEHDTPSYDMDEFIRLSLERLNGPGCYSAGIGLMPA
jgi:hypothetical protein